MAEYRSLRNDTILEIRKEKQAEVLQLINQIKPVRCSNPRLWWKA